MKLVGETKWFRSLALSLKYFKASGGVRVSNFVTFGKPAATVTRICGFSGSYSIAS